MPKAVQLVNGRAEVCIFCEEQGLATQPRLASNSRSSCLSFLVVGLQMCAIMPGSNWNFGVFNLKLLSNTFNTFFKEGRVYAISFQHLLPFFKSMS
jgi:hypothetical protein